MVELKVYKVIKDYKVGNKLGKKSITDEEKLTNFLDNLRLISPPAFLFAVFD
jgi:hypothetical protein